MPEAHSLAFIARQLLDDAVSDRPHGITGDDLFGLMVGGVAHDINNLLTIISGNLSLLAHQLGRDPCATRRIGAALSSVQIGAELTNGMLEHCRNRVGASFAVERVGADRYWEIVPLLEQAAGPGVHVVLEVKDGVGGVLMNFSRFMNALLNLAVNARDAMDGEGILRVTVRNGPIVSPAFGDGTGGRVLVSVADNGRGIAAEQLERVFLPFFTTKPTGTGLGLANVAAFARCASADFSVSSEVGHGTVFTLAFPRA